MPLNDLAVSQIVANAALAEFVTNNSLLLTGARTYETDFSKSDYVKGDSIRIRRQNRYNVTEGRISVPQAQVDTTETLVIDQQLNADVQYSSKELTLYVDTGQGPFNERVVRPMVQELSKKVEEKITTAGITQLNYASGTPGTLLNAFTPIAQIGADMAMLNMPVHDNAYLAITYNDGVALQGALQNAFNPTLNEDISFRASLGHLGLFDIYQNQSIRQHTAGSGSGDPVVDGEVTSGTTIVLKSATPSAQKVFRAGDTVSFSGVYAVQPIGRQSTGRLMQFVVQADADATGGGAVTLSVLPAINSDLADPLRNVTNPIADDATVILAGAGTTYNVNYAYCPRGLDIVIPPMEMLPNVDTAVATDKDLNVSIRVERYSDPRNDLASIRCDILFGFLWHPQYAVKVFS